MKNKTKILLVVTADILVFAVILLSFAWFHHVKPQFDANHAFPLPEKRENLLHGKYEDKFTADGSIQKTENSYRSGNVSVEILSRDITVGGYPVHYYMADIYIKDISSFAVRCRKSPTGGSVLKALPQNIMQLLQLPAIFLFLNRVGLRYAMVTSTAKR